MIELSNSNFSRILNSTSNISISDLIPNPTSTGGTICMSNNYSTLASFHECVRADVLSGLRYMTPTQASIYTFLYICIALLGVIGNGQVMFVVIRKKEMRTTRNVFIVNLALANFLLALILVPFLWMPAYRIEFPYGPFMCKFAQSVPGTNIFCSALTVSVIAVDRYFTVSRTRLGPEGMKSIQAVSIALLIWLISMVLSILNLLHFDIKDYALPLAYVPPHLIQNELADFEEKPDGILLFQRCELHPQPCLDMANTRDLEKAELCYKYYEAAISVIMALFIYAFPMPILVVFNCLLTRFLAHNERQQSLLRHRAVPPPQDPTPTPLGTNENVVTETAACFVRNSRRRWRRPRRTSRTTRLLFAMAFSNAILWLPFILISMLIQLGPRDITAVYQHELQQMDDAAKLVSMLSICTNPFLYGYLNTNFKREFMTIFNSWKIRCCCCMVREDSRQELMLQMATRFSPTSNYVRHAIQDEILQVSKDVKDTDVNIVKREDT